MNERRSAYKEAADRMNERRTESGIVRCDILIVGAGVSGMSLAAALKERNGSLDILIADRQSVPGGVLVQCLHQGFESPVPGQWLDGPAYASVLYHEVCAQGIKFLFDTHITDLYEEASGKEKEITAEAASAGKWIRVRAVAVILCCGAIERTAGMLQIPGTRPEGVFSAGEVQRMLNLEGRLPGKRAAVLGSGNMGLLMADAMLRAGMEIAAILEKEDHITASAVNKERYLWGRGHVIRQEMFRLGNEADHIYGEKRIEGIVTKDAGEVIACDTLVIAAGLLPDRQLLNESDLRKDTGRIRLFGNCDRIYPVVSAIRLMAGRMAEDILRSL